KKARNFTASERKVDANLFTGLAVCSKCGRPMNKTTFKRKAGSGHNTHTYPLCGAAMHDTSNCGYSGIRYDAFESSVLGLLCQEETIIKALSGDSGPSPLDMLKGKLADVQQRAESYLQAFDGNPSPRAAAKLRE